MDTLTYLILKMGNPEASLSPRSSWPPPQTYPRIVRLSSASARVVIYTAYCG